MQVNEQKKASRYFAMPHGEKREDIIYMIHDIRTERYFLEVTIREQEMALEKLKHNDTN